MAKLIKKDDKILLNGGKAIVYPYMDMLFANTMIPYNNNIGTLDKNTYALYSRESEMSYNILSKKGYYELVIQVNASMKSYKLNSKKISYNGNALIIDISDDFKTELVDIYFNDAERNVNAILRNHDNKYTIYIYSWCCAKWYRICI